MKAKTQQVKSIERIKKHGEVLTAKREVEAMLDLSADSFKTVDKLFLEPACGDGNFLVAILKRKLTLSRTKEDVLTSLKSIYGSDLLDDNIKLARERLFKEVISFFKTTFNQDPDQDFIDNITKILETNIKQSDFLNDKSYKNIKFDLIIGNPPYQKIDGGGTGDSAKPIYQLFIKRSKELNPENIVMIIPSRWMKGGKGLDRFRQEMINDTRIKIIYDFENGKTCFPDLNIDGGVCYFLWSKNYNGKTEYHHYALDNKERITKRFLKNEYTETVIRDYRQMSIIEKSAQFCEEKFSTIVYSRNPYGFFADLFNSPERYKTIELSEKKSDGLCKIYGVKGKKGGAKRVIGYIKPEKIQKNKAEALNYKLFFSKAYTTTSTVPPEIILASPKEVCTETFLQIGNFKNKKEAENCLNYIKTKFFRALLFFNRHSLNISKKSFNLIPLQNFSEDWNDEKLFAKYGFNKNEIDFINSTIKPMI